MHPRISFRVGVVTVASCGVLLGAMACTSSPSYLPPCLDPNDPNCVLTDASADGDASHAADAKAADVPSDAGEVGDAGEASDAGEAGCPPDFCVCTCSDGGKGSRPQCGLVNGNCIASDPCISGLDTDGGWLVCGI
jgi:hypothetical protein